jgi:uncharacterized RDD family membrane protein YckC
MSPQETEMSYAGFWRRFAAYLIDAIVVSVGLGIVLVVLNLLGLPLFEDVQTATQVEGLSASAEVTATPTPLATVIIIVVEWLYFAGLESSALQATVGKLALGIRVTDLQGERIGFGRATGRLLAKIISALILYIGFIMAGFTARKQALHDMICGTLVVR